VISLLYRLADATRRRARGEADHGRWGEDIAHRFLRQQGCTVVARNYRAYAGAEEIDLVVWDGATLAFVEVKARATGEFGAPERAVDRDKEEHVARAARAYARRAGITWDRVRFDIVSVVLASPPRVEWLRDAFR
jgi:putative endonuclease